MKIVIDARIMNNFSGPGRYIERLLHFLEEKDQQNDYLILVGKEATNLYRPINPRFKVAAADFKPYSFSEQMGFNNFLRDLKPDLVHFCMPQQPLLYTKPAVTTVHDLILLRVNKNDMSWLELRFKKLVWGVLLWLVAHRAKAIITPTKDTKDDLVRFSGINPDKVHAIHIGGVTSAQKSTPMPEYVGQQFIVYVGRAEPYKNNRGLIEAHQVLLGKHPDLRLVIVGKIDSFRQADIEWVKQKGYKNVDFPGFVEDEHQAWLYANCRAYVSASLMEGFGLPALEAMVNGAPVVSANTTASPEVLGDAAYYFDPYKAGDMARAIGDVLSDPNLATDLKQKGVHQAQKYSWETCAEQTLSVYRQVLAQK